MSDHRVLYRIEANENVTKVMQRVSDAGRTADSRFNGLNTRLKANNTSMVALNEKFKTSERNIGKLGDKSTVFDRIKNKIDRINALKISPQISLPGSISGIGNIGSNLSGLIGSAGGLGIAAGGVGLAVAGVGALGVGLVKLEEYLRPVVSEFEKYDAVLTNSLGSQKAAKLVMSDIVKLASNTPFQVNNLTDSWVRLANQGFRPTMSEMVKMGDLSASTGKDITMLTEAILDAQTGEFERLKEFGIRAEKHGSKVKFTFKGISKEVDFTSSHIQKYILGLGELKGVSGSMAAISATHGGEVSNLEDKYMQLKLTLGTALKPILTQVIASKGALIDKLQQGVYWLDKNKSSIASMVQSGMTHLSTFIGYTGQVFGKIFEFINRNKEGIKSYLTGLKNWYSGYFSILQNAGTIVKNALSLIRFEFDGFQGFMFKATRMIESINPFKWVGDFVFSVFPAFKSKWKEFKDMMSISKFFEPDQNKKSLIPAGGDRRVAYKNFSNLLATDKERSEVYGSTTEESSNAKGKSSVSSKINDLVSGGRNSNNFHISIGSLINEQNINTSTLTHTASQIKQFMTEILMTSIRDAQLLEGSR